MKICPQCGEDNPDKARFCMACSSALSEESPSDLRVRKTVTVVFCDMTGSTSMGEKLDPESLGRVMARYYDASRRVIEGHGGTVAKFIGDAVMGVFGIPILHEDDALRAVRAAAEIPDAIAKMDDSAPGAGSIQVRIGVNTGEVVAGDPSMGDALITGDAVNVAARLEQAAPPGHIYIGPETYRLVRDAVEVEEIEPLGLRGKAAPLSVFRLEKVKPGVAGHERRMDSPMVGRDRQRQLLRQVFDAAREDQACHLFTLLGPAGVGKSRLVGELVEDVGEESTFLRGRCLPYGEGITFWPVVEILREASGAMESDTPDVIADKIRNFLRHGDGNILPAGFADAADVLAPLCDLAGLVDSPTTNDQRFWAIRRLFEEMGKHRPLIVSFDDIHWAEPALLDLLEHIADWSRGSALLLLCMARPDLLDMRPGWGGGKFNATTTLLEPLNEGESKSLIANLLGEGGELPEDVLDRILTAAEGNPLYLEEMLSMLIDDGVLQRSESGWIVGDVSRITVPPSIQALIAARLDRLGREERVVIERAAVIGKEFDLRSLVNLMPGGTNGDTRSLVMALVRKDLLRPAESDPTGEGFQFRHLLIQDAAYGGLPKEARADLHHRFADWVEAEAVDGVREYDEIVGHHLERAARYLRELGIEEERAEVLRGRAAERLGSAGVRAYARADGSAAENLLTRAIDLLPPEETLRMELLPFLGAAKGDRSDLAGAELAYREAIELAVRHSRDDVRWHGEVAIEHLKLATAPMTTDLHVVREKATEAIEALQGTGNDLALTLAWFLVVTVDQRLGQFASAGEAAERALEHARAARQPRQEADACGLVGVSLLLGSQPLSHTIEVSGRNLEQAGGNTLLQIWASGEIAAAELLLRREDQGRARMATAGDRLRELGLEFGIAAMDAFLADCELALGNVDEAERLFRGAHELLGKIGDESGAAAVASALGRACLLQGDIEEAERLTAEGERGLPENTLHFRSRWRGARALLLARAGDIEEAKKVALAWQHHIDSTDALLHRADARMDMAEILRSGGDPKGARDLAQAALGLYRQKEDRADEARAESFLAELA